MDEKLVFIMLVLYSDCMITGENITIYNVFFSNAGKDNNRERSEECGFDKKEQPPGQFSAAVYQGAA